MSTFSGHNYLKDKIKTELFRNKVFTRNKMVQGKGNYRGGIKTVNCITFKPKSISNFCFDLRMAKLRKLIFHCTWDKKALKCPTYKWHYFNSL